MRMNTTLNMSAFFPVIFFDGQREIEIGDVGIYPTMNYKLFQSVLSQTIGISPHQITIYFERYNPPFSFNISFHRRRFPVTNKFNFSAVFNEPNSFFWVVLKRSRRLRRRKPKRNIPAPPITDTGSGDINSVKSEIIATERKPGILRHNSWPYDEKFSQFKAGDVVQNWSAAVENYLDYANDRMRVLGRERERYLMSLNLDSNVYSELHTKGAGCLSMNIERVVSEDGASCSSSSGGGAGERMVVCDVCATAELEGQEAIAFHCCKYDRTVAFGFRSPAGPIVRPTKH